MRDNPHMIDGLRMTFDRFQTVGREFHRSSVDFTANSYRSFCSGMLFPMLLNDTCGSRTFLICGPCIGRLPPEPRHALRQFRDEATPMQHSESTSLEAEATHNFPIRCYSCH